MFVVERDYSHKTFGNIGAVSLELNDKGVLSLDGTVLSEASVNHLLRFALQTLQDSYAGSDNSETAKENFAAKYGKLIDGTIGTRVSGGESVSDEVRIGRKLMRAEFKKDKNVWKKFVEMPEEKQIETLDKNIEKNGEKFAAIVAKEIKRLAEVKKENALIGKELSFEL